MVYSRVGEMARGRGTLVTETLRYIELATPKVVVLENVRAFERADNGDVLA